MAKQQPPQPTQQDQLEDRQLAIIEALLCSKSVEDAARQAEVSSRTVHRYLQNPVFVAAYRKAQDEALNSAIAVLKRGAATAAVTLAKIADDETIPASVRVSASGKLLDLVLKSQETDELRRRVAELEANAQATRDYLVRQAEAVN